MRRIHHCRAWAVGALLALATAAGAGEAMTPPEDAAALTVNVPAPGSLENPGEVAWHSFILTEPTRIVIDGYFESTAALTLFQLTESMSPVIEPIFVAQDRIGEESGLYLAAETYYLRVAMEVFEGTPLAYALDYRWIDPITCDADDLFEPDDAWGQAVDMPFGVLQAPAGLCAADRDWRRFTLDEPARVVLTVYDWINGDERVEATLYDATISKIGSGFGTWTYDLAPGVYFVEFRGEFDFSSDIHYRAILDKLTYEPDAFEPDDAADTANAIELGVPVIGHSIVPAGDEDWFSFTLPAAATIRCVANGTVLRWFSADLTDLGGGSLRTLDAGDYFLRVTANSLLFDYRLDLWDDAGPDPYENDDTILQARPLGHYGQAQIRNFDTAGDEDWAEIVLNSAGILEIFVLAIGAAAAPEVTVFDATGELELASGTDYVYVENFISSVFVRIRNGDGASFGPGTSYQISAIFEPQQGSTQLPGTIVGTVLQSAESEALAIPVPGATVSLGIAATISDRNGVFRFPDLPAPRSWSLTATATGYAASEPVPVFLGSRVARTTIALTPSPAPLIAVDDADRTAPWTAGNAAFAIGNGGGGVLSWSASVIEGGDWLTIATGANGVNDGTISTAYKTNVAAAARTGIIQVTAPGASNSGLLLSVAQDGGADGTVRVTLNPAEAVAAGARWRVNGGEWRGSGATLALAPGVYTISYAPASGWIRPPSEDVTIAPEALSALDRTYAPRQAGDANGDGQVNAVDIQSVINAVLGNGSPDVDGDVNGDNQLDAADVQQMILYALGVG